MQLNPVSSLLVQWLKEDQGKSGQVLLNEVAAALNHPRPETVIEGGTAVLEDLRRRDVILGTR